MTFHLHCQLVSSVVCPQFFSFSLSLSSRASMNSHLLPIRSSLRSAKNNVYEKTDGLRWSDEDRVSGGPISDPAG